MLHVHRAERADVLVTALGDALAEPLPDPLATEVIAVPSRGIERWIAQELAARLGSGSLGSDGVCANVAFPFPGRLIRDAVASGSGIAPDADAWLPERLTWPLLAIVDTDPTAPMLGPLRTHVGGATPDPMSEGLARRLGAVRHVADLFDRYGVHRPGMVCRWRDGDDVGPDGAPLPPRHRWQPALWRAVRERIDLPSFAERRDAALAALAEDPDLLDLPPRLAMFGLTALPAAYLEVVAAMGAHRELHLLLLHPSRDLWDRVAARTADWRTEAAQVLPLRGADPTAALPRHPLLRSWGRDVRELQLITPLPDEAAVVHHGSSPAQHDDPPADDDPPAHSEPSLLQRLQTDVRADRHPGTATDGEKPPLAADDRSVQLHDCHGRLRQVEVLRDALLHLLAETDDLEPRDIIVMCPDIETFAPLITAVFGGDAVVDDRAPIRTAADAPPPLRVRLADRSLRRTNPVLDVVSQILDLVDGRVTASDVLDLAFREPVRRRFGFAQDDLETLETWVGELQIRWGLDARHRRRQGLPEFDAHTWEAGLRRLLLGAAMADEDLRLVDGVAPYDGLEGQASDLAGRFVELVARLEAALEDLGDPRPVDGWRAAVGAVVDRLTDTGSDDVWQRVQLHRVLDDLVDEATVADRTNAVALTLPEIRTALSERLTGRPSTGSHRTGDLTFATLVPMRTVPHRVVCLLGLDDGTFPRQSVPDSDDVLARAPRVGDRDPRSEDRQLLLDALMAATETFVVTYAGRDVRTNEDRPPAVPVDELRDTIDRTVRVDDGRRPRDHVTVRHPLAEHDPRNFAADGLRVGEGPWGFDEVMLAAAETRGPDPSPPPPFLAAPLPPTVDDVIALDDLVAFLQHPAKAFVRQRLAMTLPSDEDAATSNGIPATLRGLDEWKVGDAVVRTWLDGGEQARTVEVLRARGLVPPGDLAGDDLDRILQAVDRIVELGARIGVTPGQRRTVDVELELPDGRQLVGTVPDVAGWQLTSVGYSKVAPKHRLASWARWLVLVANDPERPWKAVTAGRHPWRKHAAHAQVLQTARLRGDVRATITAHLERLVDLYDRGMRSPIPLYCAASAKSAEQRYRGEAPTRYVDKEWTTGSHAPFPKEDLDPYHLLVLGGQVPTDALLSEPCRDPTEATWADDTRRFVAYAWRLWEPILTTEQGRDR